MIIMIIIKISSWYLASVTWAPGPLLAVAWMPRHQVTSTFSESVFHFNLVTSLFVRVFLCQFFFNLNHPPPQRSVFHTLCPPPTYQCR